LHPEIPTSKVTEAPTPRYISCLSEWPFKAGKIVGNNVEKLLVFAALCSQGDFGFTLDSTISKIHYTLRVWAVEGAGLQHLRALEAIVQTLAFRAQGNVVSLEYLDKNNLDFVTREEAARACVPAVAKGDIVRVGCDELMVVFFALLSAKFAEAERMEFGQRRLG
jgi:hypothetical protein